jgi:peroxiredoxin
MSATAHSSGAKAPNMTLHTTEGAEVRLSDLWSERKTVLVFLRHFG